MPLCISNFYFPPDFVVRIGGGFGLTSAPGDMVSSTKACGGGGGQNEINP